MIFNSKLRGILRTQVRHETSSSSSTLPVAPTRVVYKSSAGGAIGGMFVGFLVGISAAGAGSYWYLLDEYQKQALILLSSVDSVERGVSKMKSQLSKVDKLESNYSDLKDNFSSKNDLSELKKQLLQTIDAVHSEHLELKVQVNQMEQDLLALSKKS